jgi:hypothetical protein
MFGQSVEPDDVYFERRTFSGIKGLINVPPVERNVYVEVQPPRDFLSQRTEKDDRTHPGVCLAYLQRELASFLPCSVSSFAYRLELRFIAGPIVFGIWARIEVHFSSSAIARSFVTKSEWLFEKESAKSFAA